MIKGELLGHAQVTRYLGDSAGKLTSGLTRSISRLVLSLQRRVKADKLSGQALKVRTGRLRRSINTRLEGMNTDQVTGYVGTNVSYARAHEYGFTGQVNVKQSLRMQTMAWGKSIEPKQVVVRAHARNVTLPERSFLRSALEEMDAEIQRELSGAVTEAIR